MTACCAHFACAVFHTSGCLCTACLKQASTSSNFVARLGLYAKLPVTCVGIDVRSATRAVYEAINSMAAAERPPGASSACWVWLEQCIALCIGADLQTLLWANPHYPSLPSFLLRLSFLPFSFLPTL